MEKHGGKIWYESEVKKAQYFIYYFKPQSVNNKADILYVEDNEDYIDFVKRALRKIGNSNITITAVTDGKTALSSVQTITNASRYQADLTRHSHARHYRASNCCKKYATKRNCVPPIVMMSTSDNPKDVEVAYQRGANAYLVKPIGIQPLTNTLKSLCDFWFIAITKIKIKQRPYFSQQSLPFPYLGLYLASRNIVVGIGLQHCSSVRWVPFSAIHFFTICHPTNNPMLPGDACPSASVRGASLV